MLNQHDHLLHLKTQLCFRVLLTNTLEWSPHADTFNSLEPGSQGGRSLLRGSGGSGRPFWVQLETSSYIRLSAWALILSVHAICLTRPHSNDKL